MPDYAYFVNLPGAKLEHLSDQSFDPASVSKLFYAVFLFAKFKHKELESTHLRLVPNDLQRYAYGTRKLSWRDLGHDFSLIQLLTFSLQNSCNVATGILADFCNRDEVNRFISQSLKLQNTTVRSESTQNRTTVSELVALLKIIAYGDLLESAEREYLLGIMQQTSRRAVIKSVLQDYLVFSKGGTTFNGARRDVAIVKVKGEFYFVVIVQLEESIPSFNKLDKILAKLHLGRLSRYLKKQDKEFGQFVKELLGRT